MKIIYYTEYGGIDWHDSCTTSEFLKENDSYNITNENLVIANHLFELILNLEESTLNPNTNEKEIVTKLDLEKYTSVDVILQSIEKNEDIYLKSKIEKDSYNSIEFKYNSKTKEVSYSFAFGQISYEGKYIIKDISDEDATYIVTENFLAPRKGVPSVVRFYEYPYNTKEQAEKALENLKLHDNYRSVKELIIVNKNEIENNDWYKINTEIIDIVKSKRLDWYDENFCIFAKNHLEAINSIGEEEK